MNSNIGFFPRLYEDELLYSWLARYHVYSPNEGPKKTIMDLFNKYSQVATPDLPSNLGVFYKNVLGFINLDLNELIEKHTFYLYYTKFTSVIHQSNVLELMKTNSEKGIIHVITGVTASVIKGKDYFYFCPECLSNDERKLGETYWRLQHQLPGVLVCTTHECILNPSNVPFRPHNRHEFVAATSENCSIEKGVNLHFTENELLLLLNIAKKIELLFTTSKSTFVPYNQRMYKDKLSETGFLKPSGSVNQKLLYQKFKDFYGDRLLNTLQINVDYNNDSCWLKAITRKHRKTFHPIRHILLLIFLEETVIYNTKKINPFGEGPYPCFNKASSHYSQLVISNVEISLCSKTKRRIGLFKCACGFQYYSKEIEQYEGISPIRITKIKEFGEIWKNKLVELTTEKNLSYRKISKFLGVDVNTVIKYSKQSDSQEVNKINDDKELILNQKKQIWLDLINRNPNKSVTELRLINKAVYMYLYRNDKAWLQENTSKKIKTLQDVKPKIDWEERDMFYFKIINEKIEELFIREPLVRVTKSRIGRELGIRSLLQNNLNKLRKTKELLEQKVESVEEFQIRRVSYISNQMYRSDEIILDWKLRKLAGLRNNLGDSVEEAISKFVN